MAAIQSAARRVVQKQLHPQLAKRVRVFARPGRRADPARTASFEHLKTAAERQVMMSWAESGTPSLEPSQRFEVSEKACALLVWTTERAHREANEKD